MIVNALDIKLQEGTYLFNGDTINLDDDLSLYSLCYSDIYQLRFTDCIFNGNLEIDNFKNKLFKLFFKNCTFNGNIIISDIEIDRLSFINTKKINSIHIDGSINNLIFNNKNIPLPLSGTIGIFANILKELNLDNLFLKEGMLDLVINNFVVKNDTESDYKKFYSTFKNAIIDSWKNTNSYFGHFANFKEIEILTDLEFNNCKFNKSYFSSANFGKETSFYDCKFYSYVGFEECKDLDNTELKFVSCNFEKYSFFDNSKFNRIEFSHSKFLEKVSFENFETNNFKIHQVTFAGAVYFDDLNKNNNLVIEKWDRKTLRAIKRELVNTHNQIDYLRFKAYELKAYKKEVDKSNLRWKYSLILYLGEESNNFGLDWTKGITFIFKWSIFFYINYIIWYAYYLNWNLATENFFVNYLKFINPFSFLKSPIEDAENYFLPFLFFMLGKIFVSYGIYQTIQAFRKFGVNGG